ncbi:MAG: restriction endonuclease subunit S [Candidatus Azambacteria bacterium]|nr:restriction endonuclease subunit S [Candidatus Azambacteria bacterium]
MNEYLHVFLMSIIGKLQLEKPTTGTSYPTVTDEDVENLIIPILPEAIQQKIADLVQKSHEARKKAKELLESAKQKVENLIEK